MTQSDAVGAPSRGVRLFTPLAGVTSLGIFLQAVTAGEFVSQKDRGGWIAVHDVVGNVTIVAALATMLVAIIALRSVRSLVAGSVALFVLLVLQTVMGHLITDAHQDGWLGVHVPLALIVFALTIWLSIRASQLRRAGRGRDAR